jgi:ATP/maltotriose-dependent transcriptional regulator MalT
MIRPVRPDGTIETGGVFVPIVRRRVVERIASAAMQRVVLLIAPAGYGKSVALRQYLDTRSEPTLRYDVLPENAGLLGFLRGMADALSDAAPDARATLAGAYEKNAASASPGTDLALWMHSHLKSYRGVIAIDDLHVAQVDREVTRFLTSLIDRTKGRVQWIIASRSTLGLPIGTWLAYGESDLAIDEHDLKFSVEEAKEAARVFRLGVRDDELFELLNLTEGWATAMTFALRSSTRSVDLRNIAAMTREMVYRYLAEQVYQTLNPEERAFIETGALLPEINVDVMISAGFDRASALLTDLRARVAFIHEDEGGKFRLHDLFRDFVVHQLELQGRDKLLATNATLARLLEDLGEDVEALRLYVQAQQQDEVLRLLAAHGSRLIQLGFADGVDVALNAPLGNGFAQQPIVLGLRGMIEAARGNALEAERLMSRAARDVADADLRRSLRLQLALLRSNQDEDSRDLLHEIIVDPGSPLPMRLEAQALLAMALMRVGEIDSACAVAEAVLEDAVDEINEASQATVYLRVGNALFQAGYTARGKELLSRAVDLGSGAGTWGVVSRANRSLSVIAILNEIDPAKGLLFAQKAVLAASRAGDTAEHVNGLIVMLGLETRRGNAERAIAVEKQIAELQNNDPSRMIFILSSQAHRKAWSGEYGDAARLFGGILDRQPYVQDRLTVRAFHALCLALADSSKLSGTAVADATAQIDQLVETGLVPGAAAVETALMLLVISEIVSGRLTNAGRMLKRDPLHAGELPAAMRAAAENLLHRAKTPSFDDPLAETLDVVRDRGYGGYARYVEAAVGIVDGQRHTEPAITLTPSELKILRQLAKGLTPKDIAAEMNRSVYTVQTHIQNLSEKLGTHGRAGAIAAARRLGFLEGVSGNGPT